MKAATYLTLGRLVVAGRWSLRQVAQRELSAWTLAGPERFGLSHPHEPRLHSVVSLEVLREKPTVVRRCRAVRCGRLRHYRRARAGLEARRDHQGRGLGPEPQERT